MQNCRELVSAYANRRAIPKRHPTSPTGFITTKKVELFESNQHCANQLLDPTYWEQLEQSQQQNISTLLKSVTDMIQQNLKLLDISKRGNKKLMEICFNKMKGKPAFYTASGKLFENSYAPSLGVQQMV